MGFSQFILDRVRPVFNLFDKVPPELQGAAEGLEFVLSKPTPWQVNVQWSSMCIALQMASDAKREADFLRARGWLHVVRPVHEELVRGEGLRCQDRHRAP
jgi:hypothetical protein